MRCPKCGFNSFESLDTCKKCGKDLTSFKADFGIRSLVLRQEPDEALPPPEPPLAAILPEVPPPSPVAAAPPGSPFAEPLAVKGEENSPPPPALSLADEFSFDSLFDTEEPPLPEKEAPHLTAFESPTTEKPAPTPSETPPPGPAPGSLEPELPLKEFSLEDFIDFAELNRESGSPFGTGGFELDELLEQEKSEVETAELKDGAAVQEPEEKGAVKERKNREKVENGKDTENDWLK